MSLGQAGASAGDTGADFQMNYAHTEDATGERSGDNGVGEAFIVFKPTGQIMWVLVDGAGQTNTNRKIGSVIYDLF